MNPFGPDMTTPSFHQSVLVGSIELPSRNLYGQLITLTYLCASSLTYNNSMKLSLSFLQNVLVGSIKLPSRNLYGQLITLTYLCVSYLTQFSSILETNNNSSKLSQFKTSSENSTF